MEADRERRMVRSEFREVISVFMAVVSLRFDFSFGFLRRVHVYAGSCVLAERATEIRHDCAVFFIAFGA